MTGMDDICSESIALACLKLEREDGSSERIKPSLKLWDPPTSTRTHPWVWHSSFH